MAKSPDSLLASLPADVFSALSPHLKLVELKFGDVLAETGGAVRRVYFPYSGVISLVVELDVGSMIETAMVGRDGVLSAAAALDGKVSLNKGVVQLAGSAGVMRRWMQSCAGWPGVRALFVRSSFGMSRCCSRSRSNRQRATPQSHSRGPHVPLAAAYVLTQEFLAQMLGVRGGRV